MVSWLTRIAALSPCSPARCALIWAGLHFRHSLACTASASRASSNLNGLGRRARSPARLCAAYGAYFSRLTRPAAGTGPLRRSSRLVVDGAHRRAGQLQIGDLQPLLQRQIPRRHHPRCRRRPTARGASPPISLPPITPTASQACEKPEPDCTSSQTRCCRSSRTRRHSETTTTPPARRVLRRPPESAGRLASIHRPAGAWAGEFRRGRGGGARAQESRRFARLLH